MQKVNLPWECLDANVYQKLYTHVHMYIYIHVKSHKWHMREHVLQNGGRKNKKMHDPRGPMAKKRIWQDGTQQFNLWDSHAYE